MEKTMKITRHPLGMGKGAGLCAGAEGYGFQPKHWIATAIGAGASLASSIIGGLSASAAAKRAERMLSQQRTKNDAWYNRRYNEDYIDTAAGQNLVRRAKEYARNQWRRAEGARVVGGGTDASAALAKDAGNKMVGDTMANIAATDQQRKAAVDAAHRAEDNRITNAQIGLEQYRAAQITDAAGKASNAILQGASAFEPNLTGGTNKGTFIPPSSGDGVAAIGGVGGSYAIGNVDPTDENVRAITG